MSITSTTVMITPPTHELGVSLNPNDSPVQAVPPHRNNLSSAHGEQPKTKQPMQTIDPPLITYTHPRLGTLRVARIGDNTWLSLADFSRITGNCPEKISDQIAHSLDWQMILGTGEVLGMDLSARLLYNRKDNDLSGYRAV